MSTVNTMETMNGLFKDVFAKNLENLVPEGLKLYNAVKFVGKEQQPGLRYHQPVILSMESGFSHGGQDEGALAA